MPKLSKMRSIQCPNSVKQCQNSVKTQSNGRVNHPKLNKPVWDPEYGLCSYTPRFSYDVSRTVIWACPRGTTDACTTGYSTGTARRVLRDRGIGGWVGEG